MISGEFGAVMIKIVKSEGHVIVHRVDPLKNDLGDAGRTAETVVF